MGRIKCPGQDSRFWRPEDVFDVECGECGSSVEFFKDDARRRCPTCGRRITNPRLSLGCAQWCQHAKECLGYDPKKLPAGQGASVADGPGKGLDVTPTRRSSGSSARTETEGNEG